MENLTLNTMTDYEGAFITSNPTKIGIILNKVLHNPNSALIIEPIMNEYWVFYYGGASFPIDEDEEINHFQNMSPNKENFEGPLDVTDKWFFDILKNDDPATFFFDAMDILNKIRNKNSIRVAVEQPEIKRKFYIYYKK